VASPGAFFLAWSGASAWDPTGGLGEGTALLLGLWLALLAVIRATFWLFNRIDEQSRMLLHLPLQLMKGLWLVWVLGLPTSIAGFGLLLANALCAWIPYVVYRKGGVRWETPDNLIRLMILVFIISGGAAAGYGAELLNLQALAVVAWAVYKARKDIAGCAKAAHFLPVPVVEQVSPASALRGPGGFGMRGEAVPQRAGRDATACRET
jgi:hypothetical protein